MKITGINIKRAREKKDITLRELARKVGVSASLLSQVETGKASPSLATLKNIADALEVTVGALIGEGRLPKDNLVVTERERKSLNRIGKRMRMYVLTSPDPNKQMEPLLFKLDKEATSGETFHKHFGQEFVLVLKGAIEITLNETKYALKKGDSMYFNSNEPHHFRNGHNGSTEALWVITPPTF